MRATVVLTNGKRIAAKLPHPGSKFVEVDVALADGCDCCRVEAKRGEHDPKLDLRAVMSVAGRGATHDYDTYRADAVALCCGTRIGSLEVKVDTFFGIDEDEAVLVHGRARVYG